MRQKDQKMRYSDTELSLIKNTFAGDDVYLYAVRKHMLGTVLSEGEQNIINQLSDEVKKLLNKVFNPTIDGDAPIFQLVDMQMGLNQDLKGITREHGENLIEIKRIEMNYIKSRLNKLDDIDSYEGLTLSQMADLSQPDAYMNIIARNYLLSYIDSFCNELRNLAGQKEETVEQTIAKLSKNSAK